MKSEESKKKIIFLVSNDLTTDNRMHKICNSLAQNNFSVELVGRYFENSKAVATSAFLPTRLKCVFNKKFLFYAEWNIRLFLYLIFNTYDVVCACDVDTLPAAFFANIIKRKKIAFDAHEYFSESPELIGRTLVQNIWQKIEQFLIPKVDIAYTVNQSLANIFEEKYKKKFEVIRSLPLKNKNLQPKQTESYFIYQGAINLGRGIKESILAIQHIPNYKLYIVGDGDEYQEIKDIIKHYKIEDRVVLFGKKTPAELIEITQNAFAGINLLEQRGLNYYYSLNNKFFDYIQAYIPQITIAFPEYIQYNQKYNVAVLVEKLIIEDVVKAMKKLIDEKEYYNHLKQNCIIASNELNWENEEPKLLYIYKNLA
jgi:glycosyltransferase involved in cell wall biosynthesis